jgi:hypothetical protein
VNGQRATVPFPLKDDDLIQIGEQRLHVKSGLTLDIKDASIANLAGYPHLYWVMKLQVGATQEEIDEAHSALAKIFDPSLHPGSEMAQRLHEELEEAYRVLGDPVRRAEYIATLI